MTRVRKASAEDLLASLTGYELLAGIIGNAKVDQFSSEALYGLVEKLKKQYPRALGYVTVRKIGDRRESKEIEQYMRFFRIGKLVFLSAMSTMPNPVEQFYRVSRASRNSIVKDLEQRNISSEQMAILKDLSQQFEKIVAPDSAKR